MSSENLLSKTDFKLASTCCKKLIYKKASYKTRNDAGEYLEMLAKGGYVIGKYAQQNFPGGNEVEGNTIDQVIEETIRLISDNENITLFEAAFILGQKFVRIDILEKEGDVLNIYEVKSKSSDSEEDSEKASKKLKEHIEDIAFQTMVLKELYPDKEIHSYLYLPDKSKRTEIDGLAGWFKECTTDESKSEIDELPARSESEFKKPIIEFIYEDDPQKIEDLMNDNLMTKILVDNEVEDISTEIQDRSDRFIRLLNGDDPSSHYKINKNCKACEFNLGEETEGNGYRECWGNLTDVNPHIFDLYHGGSIKSENVYYLNELISEGKVSFSDLDVERFKRSDGSYGSRGRRQKLQFEKTNANDEWINPDLKSVLENLDYPLHFIDFETYAGAIPHHEGMRPYEKAAFQWSCHTISSHGSDPVHSEFLNDEDTFPNFRFAELLMYQIGDEGTPLMWSHFENTVLKNILEQMDNRIYINEPLKEWLTNITLDNNTGRPGRFVDMNVLTLKHFFHPDMKGKTSIKKVLPAVWINNEDIRNDPWFVEYTSSENEIKNPYDTLSPIINEYEMEEIVNEGTGAMRVYHELMFGLSQEDEERKNLLRQLLLQYCKLDTMAMVMIWKYWMGKCGLI